MWGEGMGPFLPCPGTYMAQERSKVELFWSQNRTVMAGLLRGEDPSGNCFMSHITSNYMGKHDLGPFKPSPGTQSGQRGSENDYIRVKKWPLGENNTDTTNQP